MLVYSWVAIGVVVGIIGHLILRDRGYDWFGEMLVGIAGGAVLGAYGPIVIGVRTGSVDILSYAGLGFTLIGAVLAVGLLIVLTPRAPRRLSLQPHPAPGHPPDAAGPARSAGPAGRVTPA